MKLSLSGNQIVRLSELIPKHAKTDNFKFNYALLKVKKQLDAELATIKELSTPPEGFEEFESKRMDLVKKYGKLDDQGNLIVRGSEFVLSNPSEFNSEFSKIKESHKELIDKLQDQRARYDKFMKESLEIDLYDLPSIPDSVDNEFVVDLFDLIEHLVE